MKLIQALLEAMFSSIRDHHLSQPPAVGKRLAKLGLAPMVTPVRRQMQARERCICR